MALGGTITELQAKMPMGEFNLWLAYRRKYGPMNPVRQFDAGPALITSMIANMHGNKTTPKQYMPYGKEPEIELDMDDDSVIDLLAKGSQARIGR